MHIVDEPAQLTPADWEDYVRTIVVPNQDRDRPFGAYAVAGRKRRKGGCPFAGAERLRLVADAPDRILWLQARLAANFQVVVNPGSGSCAIAQDPSEALLAFRAVAWSMPRRTSTISLAASSGSIPTPKLQAYNVE